MGKVYAGILIIGEQGCNGLIGIALNGENQGRIVYGCEELEYRPIFVEERNFLEWYENWLDRVISGESIKSQGNNSFNEEELINRFIEANDKYWKIIALSYIRFHNSISLELLKILYNSYKNEEELEIKMYLLNVLVKFDYEKMVEELKKMVEENPAELLKILHLYRPNKTIDWIESILKIYEDKSLNVQIKEYIYYVTAKDEESVGYII